MIVLKTIMYLIAFIGIVGYLETGNLMYTIATAIGVIGIIKIKLNKHEL